MQVRSIALGLAALVVSGVLSTGCHDKASEEVMTKSAQRAEQAATRAEDAARRTESAASRVEAAAQRAEAAASKAESSLHRHMRK